VASYANQNKGVFMVGKPNLSETGDERPGLQGSARPTPGLAALDQEREASMADEGGVSAAVMEAEDPTSIPLVFPEVDSDRGHRARLVGAVALGLTAGAALGLWTYGRGR
jgi:hypothetical protein